MQTSKNEMSELVINDMHLKKARLLIRACNHKLRQKILQFIHEQHKTSVTNIYKSQGLEQSVASQHLAILRRAGFVKTERAGKCIFYMVNYKRLDEVQSMINEFLK